VQALELVADWPGMIHAVAVVDLSCTPPKLLDAVGDTEVELAWASITKLATAHAALALCDEGVVSLDDIVTGWGATLAQLLSHAGGTAPGRPEPLCEPGTRRIYSSAGYELIGAHLERSTGLAIATVLTEAVLDPLGLERTRLAGTAGAGIVGPLDDLVKLLCELSRPALLDEASALAERTSTQPHLAGVLPGFGSFDPCEWGLGPEVKGGKSPHWTPPSFGPATFGHFGQAGGFAVIEPSFAIGVCSLSDVSFGTWAAQGWPRLLDDVVAEIADTRR
jgi:CubicO group peptidase (beta-lactamase class C family)